jgi:catechol 2,3-dioxygenase-like lactoylglutathione lyase family enzyme
MKPVRFRVARPTDNLESLRQFYVEGLGLLERGSFRGHSGYDGLILGTVDGDYEIEFTSHVDGSPCPAPSRDNLLIFYLRNRSEIGEVAVRLQALGSEPVEPENPYWLERGLTFEDADGWRIVLVDREEL